MKSLFSKSPFHSLSSPSLFTLRSVTGFILSLLLHALLLYFLYVSTGNFNRSQTSSERSIAASLSMFEDEQQDSNENDSPNPQSSTTSELGQQSASGSAARQTQQTLIASFNLSSSDNAVATDIGALDVLPPRYLVVLRNKIAKRLYDKVFANNIRSAGGITEVTFDIDKLGRISNVSVVTSSGDEVFDQAVIDSIIELGRYKPFGIGVNREKFRMGYGFKTLE